MIAQVIVDIAHGEVDRVFDYKIEDNAYGLGCRVEVPFGRQKIEGFIIGIKEKSDIKNKSNSWSEKRSPYYSQLVMPQWIAYREFIFSVRGRKCEVCGKPSNLQVHHIHYENNRFAWEYLPNEVLVVCKSCHWNIHKSGE